MLTGKWVQFHVQHQRAAQTTGHPWRTMKPGWWWTVDMIQEMDKTVERDGGCYGIEVSATKGDGTDRRQMMLGMRVQPVALTPPVCLHKELTWCVRSSPTCPEPPRRWHGQDEDLFPGHPG